MERGKQERGKARGKREANGDKKRVWRMKKSPSMRKIR